MIVQKLSGLNQTLFPEHLLLTPYLGVKIFLDMRDIMWMLLSDSLEIQSCKERNPEPKYVNATL